MATVPTVRSVWVALLITIAAGFLVVAAEVDRLVAAASSPSYSAWSLFSPFHLEATDAHVLGTWRGASGTVHGLPDWLATELVALCIVGLACLVLLLFAAFSFGDPLAAVIGWGVVGALGTATVIWTFWLLAHLAPSSRPQLPIAALAWPAWVLAELTWLAVLVCVAPLLYRAWLRLLTLRTPDETPLRLWLAGAFRQRFSLIVLALLAALTIVPFGGVMDQAPDVVRRMLPTPDSPADAVSLGMIAITGGGLTAALLYLGAVRAYGLLDPDIGTLRGDRKVSTGAWWFFGGLAGAAALLLAMWTGIAAWGSWSFLLPAVAVVIGAISWWKRDESGTPLTAGQQGSIAAFAVTRHVGRLLAYAIASILGVAIARALAPIVVQADGPVLSILILLIPIAIACLVWVVVAWALSRGGPLDRPTTDGSAFHPSRVGRTTTAENAPVTPSRAAPSLVVAAVVFVLISALLIAFAIPYGRFAGVLGVIMTALAGLTAFFTLISIWTQRVEPPPLFRLLGARHTPAVTLLVLIALVTNAVSIASPHDLVPPAPSARTAALTTWNARTWDTAVGEWLQQPGTCDLTAPGSSTHVRPMIFLALDGGGMRAAYWAADFLHGVLQNRCLTADVVAASSVSGGSEGLAVTDALGSNGLEGVRAIAGQGGLAASVGSLLSSDLLAGSYGIDLKQPGGTYADRATVLTRAWSEDARAAAPRAASASLSSPYPLDPSAAQLPWVTVFNSTSAVTGCVVTQSNVDLYPDSLGRPPSVCATSARPPTGAGPDPAAAPAGTYQLLSSSSQYAGIPLADAALLSSRFPVISPSAITRGPGSAVADQLIDGGYADNSGLTTVDDLLASALPRVEHHNAQKGRTEVVVPIVISLSNDPSVLAKDSPPAKPRNELMIPVQGKARGGSTLDDPDALAELAATLSGGTIGALSPTKQAVVRSTLCMPQVLRLVPTHDPGAAVPLGWTLSSTSMRSLDAALKTMTGNAFAQPAASATPCIVNEPQPTAKAFSRLVSLLSSAAP